MKRIPFFIVDAFTQTPFQGNRAGVFLDDEGILTPEECAVLCDELGQLESAFVTPSSEPDVQCRLRYFIGTQRTVTSLDPLELTVNVTEVPLCGHATVAAAAVLAHVGRIPSEGQIVIRNNLGRMPIGLRSINGGTEITLFQKAGTSAPPLSAGEVSEIATAVDVMPSADGLPVQVVSTGTPWLLVQVADRATVDGIDPVQRAEEITALSRQHGTFGAYVFTVEKTEAGGLGVWSRCFAPIADLPEDPVTGSASGALGCYLAEHDLLADGTEAVAQQGFAGGRGGTARIRVTRNTDGWQPEVSGTSIIVAEGTFRLP
jgi:PhzF family phenazine biosynthesis protein